MHDYKDPPSLFKLEKLNPTNFKLEHKEIYRPQLVLHAHNIDDKMSFVINTRNDIKYF